MGIRFDPTRSALWLLFSVVTYGLGASPPPTLFLQKDGSLMVLDSKGQVLDFVKKGSPRQAIRLGEQTAQVGYGVNSAGKTTILVSLPSDSRNSEEFTIAGNQIELPPKASLRLVLADDFSLEKMDGTPAGTVKIRKASDLPPSLEPLSAGIPSSTTSSVPLETPLPSSPERALTAAPSPISPPLNEGWPGKQLTTPIPASEMEEEMFYARTDLGVRFMSSLSLVSISGSQANIGNYTQKQFAFGTGYRQDFDVGVQLIDWFGLSFETGFALNSVRGNTEGMTVSDGTFWTFPFMAQLCFQYPNDSGWIPYLNFGFGGAVTVLKLGQVNYIGAPSISGIGNCVTNAYQISTGVRYRLYEDLSITLGYKFFGNSQGTVNLDNGVQLTLGSPVTNSAEVGVNFAF